MANEETNNFFETDSMPPAPAPPTKAKAKKTRRRTTKKAAAPKRAPIQTTSAKTTTDEPKEDLSKTYRVKVTRLNCERENRHLQFPVNTCSKLTGGKKWIFPGQVVELTKAQINVLRDSVEESAVPIPNHGGMSKIYQDENPIKAAELEWPGFDIEKNPETGDLRAVRREPNYSIDFVDLKPF